MRMCCSRRLRTGDGCNTGAPVQAAPRRVVVKTTYLLVPTSVSSGSDPKAKSDDGLAATVVPTATSSTPTPLKPSPRQRHQPPSAPFPGSADVSSATSSPSSPLKRSPRQRHRPPPPPDVAAVVPTAVRAPPRRDHRGRPDRPFAPLRRRRDERHYVSAGLT